MEPLRPHQSRWYRRTDPQGRALLALLFPLAGVCLCQLVTLQEPAAAWAWMGSHAGMTRYTYLVLLLAQLLVTTLTDSLFCGQLLTLPSCSLLSVTSHLKQAANSVPLLVSDLAMVGQAGQVAGFLCPGMELGEGTWGGIALAALLFLTAFVWSRPARPLDGRWRLGALRLLAALLTWVLLSPVSAVLLTGEEGESQSMRNDQLGLLAGLYSAARENAMAEPDSHSEDGMNRILLQLRAEAEQPVEPAVKPNVMLVVSESFFGPTRLSSVFFSADPVPNFHTLAEVFPSGVFLSSTYVGGTGNVEMEPFTGIPSAFLGVGESLADLGDTSAYRRVSSLARVFGAAGYKTFFVHSYNDELYDRARNIPALGFDQIIYQDDSLVDKTYAGGYVSDDTLADKLIARFEAKGNGPVFLYGLATENHQPYFGGKFNTPAPVAALTDNLSGKGAGVLDALAHGLIDTSAAPGKLTDYFAQAEELTILVFLGDHLPGLLLGGDDTLYTCLGYASSADTGGQDAEELKWMHSTGFLVWNNFGTELEAPAEVSCIGLGTYLLEQAGLPKPLCSQWVPAAMEGVILYQERLFVTVGGTPSHTPLENCESLVAV